jgi:phage gpG-like protein
MAIVTASISQFFEKLREVENQTLREMMRFQLELGLKIQNQVRENIKATFGKGRGSKSEITERAYGSTARRAGRGGNLFQSVALERSTDGSVTVSAGGPGVPYAAIHEKGGVIRPVRAKFLTIPFQPKYAGTRAREHDLYFDFDEEWGPVLRQETYGRSSRSEESTIAFLLRRKATIPARPYFQPAVDKVTADQSVKDVMVRLIGRSSLEVSVK